MKQTAVYIRVSTSQQSCQSQRPDLERWLAAQSPDKIGKVVWYEDKATGKNMDRPGWQKLQAAIDIGQVGQVVVWRLDRLGRTAAGLCQLFERLQSLRINLISVREAIDLESASGRLLAHILASVAAFETELRGERVRAGQCAARVRGVKWGGSQRGRLLKVTPEQVTAIAKMKQAGERPTNMARITGLDRGTIYRILKRA